MGGWTLKEQLRIVGLNLTNKSLIKMPSKKYGKIPNWQPNKTGTTISNLQKMLYLFQDEQSLFSLHGKLKLDECIKRPLTYFKFNHVDHGNIYLFKPNSKLIVHNTTNNEILEKEGLRYNDCFNMVSELLNNSADTNSRFIFFIPEPNGFGKGHAVTLVLDYNAGTTELSPIIYDSVGRGTFVDTVAKFFSPSARFIMEHTVSKYLKEVFPKCSTIRRIGYDHQARMINGYCGLFSFRVAHHALDSFAKHGLGQLYIPPSQNCTSSDTNFLTAEHIDDIQACIRDKEFTFDDIHNGFENIIKADLSPAMEENAEFIF